MDKIRKICFIVFAAALFTALSPPGLVARRPKIIEFNIENNEVFSNKTLKQLMVTGKSSLFKTRRFFREVFREDLEKLRSFYTGRGYLAAAFSEEISVNEEDNTAIVTIRVDEGERFRFSTIAFLGNEFYSNEKLAERAAISRADFFSKQTLSGAASRLLSLYTDTGFSEVSINTDMNVNYTLNTVSIDFFITEEDRYRINGIDLRGNSKTRNMVLLRELAFKSGQYVNFSKLFQSRQKLMRTGLFSSVFINPVSDGVEYNKKDILIEVEERDSIELAASAGYDTREHFWQKLEVSNRNLYGTSRKLTLTLRRSRVSRGAEALFSSPWNFGIPLNIDLNIYTHHKKKPAYEVIESGGGMAAGKSLSEFIDVSLSYDHKLTEFRDMEAEEEAFKEKRVRKNIITLAATYDSRDNLFYPARGSYANLKNEVMLGDYSFLRTSADSRIFFPLSSRLIAGSSIRGAAIFSRHPVRLLPPDERLYTGGPHTVRGFRYQGLGPADLHGKPTGGKAELVWNIAELRLNFYKSLGILVFADTGNLWGKLPDINLSELRSSAGGGLTMTLPFGVFRLEYGFNLDPREGEEAGSLFFGSGMVF